MAPLIPLLCDAMVQKLKRCDILKIAFMQIKTAHDEKKSVGWIKLVWSLFRTHNLLLNSKC